VSGSELEAGEREREFDDNEGTSLLDRREEGLGSRTIFWWCGSSL
jgi:hypothetical protein